MFFQESVIFLDPGGLPLGDVVGAVSILFGWLPLSVDVSLSEYNAGSFSSLACFDVDG